MNSSLYLSHSTKRLICSFLICTLIVLYGSAAGAFQLLKVDQGDEWSYLKGKVQPPRSWTHKQYDDSDWMKGRSGFGYSNKIKGTQLNDMKGKYEKVYLRKVFSVSNLKRISRMELSIECDGKYIAYINGIEVIRNSVGTSGSKLTTGISQRQQLDISGFAHELLLGENVLSIQCENDDINSSSFSFVPAFEIQGE